MSKSKNVVEEFDEAIKRVTDDRGAIYGHPLDDFNKIEALKSPLRACKNKEIRHALEMIAVKMARLVETPDHVDSMIDIAGYARCMAMIIQEQRDREDQEREDSERPISRGIPLPNPPYSVKKVLLRNTKHD